MSYNHLSNNELSGSIQADVEDAPQSSNVRQFSTPSVPPPPVQTSISSSDVPENQTDSNPAASILSQSAHPGSLIFLYLFRSAAVATYLFCGFVSSSYVFSTVLVVILLSLDFWTVRNVSGRRLVGLRFWSQVDEDGTAFWVFESRGPEQQANVVDAKMFWIALYTFPMIWIGLFFVGLLKFNLSFLPIVLLALVFNLTNAIGYTYGDRDAKRRWATNVGISGLLGSVGGFGSSVVGGLAQNAMGRMFR